MIPDPGMAARRSVNLHAELVLLVVEGSNENESRDGHTDLELSLVNSRSQR